MLMHRGGLLFYFFACNDVKIVPRTPTLHGRCADEQTLKTMASERY